MSSESPLFSIAVPTRNRSGALKKCIECCLAQTYEDFEVVIVENSDDDRESRAIVEAFSDKRIRYERTGNLYMSANWEAALAFCKGKFLFPIAEKILLHKQALEVYAQAAHNGECDLICSSSNALQGVDDDIKIWPFTVAPTADAIASVYANYDMHYFNFQGLRGYSVLISADLFHRLRAKYSPVIYGYAPDFVLVFMGCLHTERFATTQTRLFSYNYSVNSNGASCMQGCKLGREFFDGYPQALKEDYLKNVPIAVSDVWNSCLDDFFRVMKYTGKGFDHSLMTADQKAKYWLYLYRTVMDIYSLYHLDCSDKLRVLYQSMEDDPSFKCEMIQKEIESWRMARVPRPRKKLKDKVRKFIQRIFS